MLFAASDVLGMGMSFGGAVSTVTDKVTCVPEDSPVIVPGPLGSPLRIQASDDNRFLVTDYRKRAIFEISSSAPMQPEELFAVQGKPLSVVKVSGSRGATYLVGNDDSKTIDLYVERRGIVKKGRQFFRKVPVQALDMAYDLSSGRIYVVDGLAAEIKVIDASGRLISSFGGFGQLARPKGIALDLVNGEVIVSDYGDSAVGVSASIQVFDLDGSHLESFTGAFSRPQGVAVAGGKIYMTDAVSGQVLVLDRVSGKQVEAFGCFGSGDGHLLMPMDLVVDQGAQTLFVADNRNGRITALPFNP